MYAFPSLCLFPYFQWDFIFPSGGRHVCKGTSFVGNKNHFHPLGTYRDCRPVSQTTHALRRSTNKTNNTHPHPSLDSPEFRDKAWTRQIPNMRSEVLIQHWWFVPNEDERGIQKNSKLSWTFELTTELLAKHSSVDPSTSNWTDTLTIITKEIETYLLVVGQAGFVGDSSSKTASSHYLATPLCAYAQVCLSLVATDASDSRWTPSRSSYRSTPLHGSLSRPTRSNLSPTKHPHPSSCS